MNSVINLVKGLDTITAEQLIELLKEVPPKTKVFIASNYGDLGQTQVLGTIDRDTEVKRLGDLHKTCYGGTGLALSEDDMMNFHEDDELSEPVVVLGF